MTAEMVRDGALAASGLLAAEVGGPSVKPYQPAGIWNPLNSFYTYPVPEDLPADELHRRTLYTFVKRNATHPGMKIFDFTNRTESIARRRSSNTPLQALVLMNDPQFVEAYRSLAADALRFAADEDAQLAAPVSARDARDADAGARRGAARLLRASSAPRTRATTRRSPACSTSASCRRIPRSIARTLAALTNVAALVMSSPDAYTVR